MVQKLKRIEVEERLKDAGVDVFTPREFRDIFGISDNTASTFIKRNLNSGLFIKLRNNYYTLKDSNPSLYLIANKLYQPSYVSLENALAYYGMIPEVVYTITSITTKPTREFTTPKGVFSYQRIKQIAYTGYSPKRVEGGVVLFADPEKALADYLYFVDLKKVSLNDRLTLKPINKKKLVQMAKLFRRPSLLRLIERVYAEQRKPRKIY
ncbi:MAG: hypothetical protein HY974_04315 [Candidatus Kerfeldbacteria bacterium]|nr:hypothetical protein [Candidatus Kerfeldbacteria bacterium]